MSIKDRFLAKVEKTNGCWLWKAKSRCGYKGGYGSFWMNGKQVAAHRASYELFVSRIPPGLAIDHVCRNTLCVNPHHLELVSPVENVMRGVSDPAMNARKTKCKRGHEFTPENTYIQQPQGWRHCLKCYEIRRGRKAA